MNLARYRRVFQGMMMAFVATGVLLRVGGQIRQIAQGLDGERHGTPVESRRGEQPSPALRIHSGAIGGSVWTKEKPLGGARVHLRGPVGRTTSTAADGTFSFSELPPGSYDLFAIAGDGLSSDRVSDLSLPKGGRISGVHLLTVPGGTLAGTVTDSETGRPIHGAVISLSADESLGAVSGQDGRYVLGGLPRGTAELSVRAEGYVSQEFAAEFPQERAREEPAPPSAAIDFPGPKRMNLSLERGVSVFGRVMGTNGPLRSVQVMAVPASAAAISTGHGHRDPSHGIPVGKTDASGRYRGTVPSGIWNLVARTSGAVASSGIRDFSGAASVEADLRY